MCHINNGIFTEKLLCRWKYTQVWLIVRAVGSSYALLLPHRPHFMCSQSFSNANQKRHLEISVGFLQIHKNRKRHFAVKFVNFYSKDILCLLRAQSLNSAVFGKQYLNNSMDLEIGFYQALFFWTRPHTYQEKNATFSFSFWCLCCRSILDFFCGWLLRNSR